MLRELERLTKFGFRSRHRVSFNFSLILTLLIFVVTSSWMHFQLATENLYIFLFVCLFVFLLIESAELLCGY